MPCNSALLPAETSAKNHAGLFERQVWRSKTVVFSICKPKRARSSLSLSPYLSCSYSLMVRSPPPLSTNCVMASSSCDESFGELLEVVRSHLDSHGCSKVSTSASMLVGGL